MEQLPTTSVAHISSFFTVLEKNGIDKESFLAEAGLDPSICTLPDTRLTWETFQMLLQKAVAKTGDEHFGLHQGEAMAGLSNILWHIQMSCPTLGEAFEKFQKYQKILVDGCEIIPKMEGSFLVFEYTYYTDHLTRDTQISDYCLSYSHSYTKLLTGRPIDFTEVRFRHEAPADIFEYERIFNCPLVFGSTMNALVCDPEIINIPIHEPNQKLLALFEKYAEEVLANQTDQETYSHKVSHLISKNLGEKIPQIDMIAKKLAISTRNLQVKLQEEDTTYSEILDQIRKDTAIYYLKNKNISITEISYLLGFSEPSVFHRSFKKWTNLPPGQFRMSHIKIA